MLDTYERRTRIVRIDGETLQLLFDTGATLRLSPEAARRLTVRDAVLRERLSAALARFVGPDDATTLARYAIALYEGVQLTHLVDRDSSAARELLI